MTTSAIAQSLPSLFNRLLPRAAGGPINPHFNLSPADLALELERMRSTPVLPKRPVLVLAGYHAWSLSVATAARTLHSLVGGPPEHFHSIAYPLATDIPTIARRIVREVSQRWPNPEPHRTTEVDVIGVSMGGIVARVAASRGFIATEAQRHRESPAERWNWWGNDIGRARPSNAFHTTSPSPPPSVPLCLCGGSNSDSSSRHLQIARLFTLATPHRGATLAARYTPLLRLDRAARDLHPDSPLLARLNASLPSARYELVCYTRLRDTWVGAPRTAPPGRDPIWLPGPSLFGHITITSDLRILADIARRLRGETPLAGSRACSAPPCD